MSHDTHLNGRGIEPVLGVGGKGECDANQFSAFINLNLKFQA